MNKLCGAARALAILLAIVAAFVTIPYVVPVLLILGAISALTNTPDQNRTVFLITIVLLLGAKVLAELPAVGTYVSSIFANLGTALLGASMLAIAIGAYRRVRSDWVPSTS